MYLDHFGLKERPFSIAPDPRYLFMSQQHREALAHLMYGIRGEGGFVLITGEVGTGKTTVCRCLLGQLPENCQVAFVINPRLSPEELLETVCDEFRIPYPEGQSYSKLLVDRINQFLLEAHAEGRNPVLMIDEAQNLSVEVLEQVRLLTNLETDQRKLLQVVLIGQPELRELLARPELRQLAQRITARFHLGALSRSDLEGYVNHRLAVAGMPHPLFSRRLLGLIHRRTGGVPRLVNLVCDRALLGSYVEGRLQVSGAILCKAMAEVFGEEGLPRPRRRWPALVVVLVLALICGGWLWRGEFARQRFDIGARPVVAPKAPAVTATAKKPVPVSLDEWLKKKAAVDPSQPFRDLLALWGLAPPAETLANPCALAAENGLRCLSLQGDTQTLRLLDRPAILNLATDSSSNKYAVVITRMGKDSCQLRIGDDSREYPLKQLAERWTGAMTLLWKPPENYQKPLRPGEQGDYVYSLLSGYGALLGYDANKRLPDLYAGGLLADMKRFQSAAGLTESGEVGPQTLIVLNRHVTDSGPRLY